METFYAKAGEDLDTSFIVALEVRHPSWEHITRRGHPLGPDKGR